MITAVTCIGWVKPSRGGMFAARVCTDDESLAPVVANEEGRNRVQAHHLVGATLCSVHELFLPPYRHAVTRFCASLCPRHSCVLHIRTVFQIIAGAGRDLPVGLLTINRTQSVRAAMVQDPAHYRWLSYCANGIGQPNARLTPHSLYWAIGQAGFGKRSVGGGWQRRGPLRQHSHWLHPDRVHDPGR